MTYQMNSRGDGVKALQEALNHQGYGLAVDGIFGSKTQSAVRDYQQKNGLAVDGIAGTNTLTALGLLGDSGTGSAGSTAAAALTVPATYGYTPGATVQQAGLEKAAAQQAVENYGSYQSRWSDAMDQLQQELAADRFPYDPQQDPLYALYQDSYRRQGQAAAEDVLARAAALTGGYGNSYATTAAGQAYASYLDGLADKGSQLYQLALDRYDSDRAAKEAQYDRYADREAADYARWQQGLEGLRADRAAAQENYADAWDQDYAAYALLKKLLAV